MVMKTKNNSYRVIFILVITMFSFAFFSISVLAATRPIITILDYKTSNEPSPGGFFNLKLDLANEGSLCATGTTVSISAGFPIITTNTASSIPVTICNPTTVSIPLRIDPTAIGGSYPLALVISYSDWSNNFYSSTNTISLLINGTPDLNANIVSSNPIDVYPGDTAIINVLVQNSGTFKAQTIKGTLYSNSEAIVKPTSSFMYLSSLDALQSSSVNFAIDIPKDSKSADYPLTLDLQYLDENRDLITKNLSIDFSIKKKAIFILTDANSQDLYPNYQGRKIILNIKNIGTENARQIKVNIAPQFPFTTDGSVRYIDSLSPGETKTAEFIIDVYKSADPGNYGVDLIFDYKDKQGNSLQDIETTFVTVKSKNLFRTYIIDYWVVWIIAIIVLIIIIIRSLLFSRKKNKNQ